MAEVEKYDDLIIGSGIGGKLTAWGSSSIRTKLYTSVRNIGPLS